MTHCAPSCFGVRRDACEKVVGNTWRDAAAGNHEFRLLGKCRQFVENRFPFGAVKC